MIRNISNITAVRYSNNPESRRPFVVERHENVQEHLSGGPRVLRTKTTFTMVHVGRYETEAAAYAAADRSARRRGGYVRNLKGHLSPSFPYKKKQ